MKREELLELLKSKGFSERIIKAFKETRREDFAPYQLRAKAYEDSALPIGQGQTISQPYVVAVMLSELDIKPKQRILEVGSGSGYVLALLSNLVGPEGKVFGLEIIGKLVEKSRSNLKDGTYENVKVYHRNGSSGLEDQAPFDRIILSAAITNIPEKLISQLKVGGILVAPKGSRFEQEIITIRRKSKTEFEMLKKLPGFLFVPMVEDLSS